MFSLLMLIFVFFSGSTLLAVCGGKKKEAKSEASKSARGAAPGSAQAEPTPDAEKKAE